MKHSTLALLFAAVATQAGVVTVVSPTQTVDPTCVAASTDAASAASANDARLCPVVQSVTSTYTPPPPPAPVPPPPPAPTPPPAPAPAPSGSWVQRFMAAVPLNTQAVDFSDNAVFAKGIHHDGTQANVVQEVFEGETVLRINIPKSAGEGSGAWRTSLNRAFTSSAQGIPAGQDFYVVYQIWMSPGYLTASNGGGGKKQSIISQYLPESPDSSQSDTDIEVVMNQLYGSSVIGAYHNPDFAGFWVPKGSDFIMQTGNPACLYSNMDSASTPCLKNVEGQWVTYQQHIKVGKYGSSTGNLFDMWVAYAADADWRPVYSNKSFPLGVDGPGYRGGWLLTWDTRRTSGKVDAFVRYKHFGTAYGQVPLSAMR